MIPTTILAITLIAQLEPQAKADPPEDLRDGGTYQVLIVSDPTTAVLKLRYKTMPIQLAGIKPQPGKATAKSTQALKGLIQGKPVVAKLDKDLKKLVGSPRVYLYRADDDLFINLEMVARGLVTVDVTKPFEHQQAFQEAEQKAKDKKIGLWTPPEPPKIIAQPKAIERPRSPAGPTPDPDYEPAAGDVAVLFRKEVTQIWGTTNMFSYMNYIKFIIASDKQGLTDLHKAGDLIVIENKTKVRVIEIKKFVKPPAAEVRVLEGSSSGKLVWVPTYSVTRLIDKDPPD